MKPTAMSQNNSDSDKKYYTADEAIEFLEQKIRALFNK